MRVGELPSRQTSRLVTNHIPILLEDLVMNRQEVAERYHHNASSRRKRCGSWSNK